LTTSHERFGDLSDALHDENGLVHRLFAELERKAAKREQRATEEDTGRS
jgi:hypothetical protein